MPRRRRPGLGLNVPIASVGDLDDPEQTRRRSHCGGGGRRYFGGFGGDVAEKWANLVVPENGRRQMCCPLPNLIVRNGHVVAIAQNAQSGHEVGEERSNDPGAHGAKGSNTRTVPRAPSSRGMLDGAGMFSPGGVGAWRTLRQVRRYAQRLRGRACVGTERATGRLIPRANGTSTAWHLRPASSGQFPWPAVSFSMT